MLDLARSEWFLPRWRPELLWKDQNYCVRCGIDNDKGDAIEDTGVNKDAKEQMKNSKLQESEGDIRLFPLASPPVQLVRNMKNKYKIQNKELIDMEKVNEV